MRRSCRARKFEECFTCKFKDCVKPVYGVRELIGEPKISEYLTLDFINETRRIEEERNGKMAQSAGGI